METEVYYHYEFGELRYIRIGNKIFLSKGTVLDIINEFDFKLRFEGGDIEDEYTDHCKDCKMNSQYYWHIELGKIGAKVFFLSKKDCMKDTYERTRYKYEEDIKEFELKISNHKKNITLLNTKIGALND